MARNRDPTLTVRRAWIVLEGWDTVGKGGVVRRLGWALGSRSFKVHPISAPHEYERAEHYLPWSHQSRHMER